MIPFTTLVMTFEINSKNCMKNVGGKVMKEMSQRNRVIEQAISNMHEMRKIHSEYSKQINSFYWVLRIQFRMFFKNECYAGIHNLF
jgi:hypothetical protein